MAESCLLYYITDRSAFRGDERSRRRHLLDKIAEASANGVDYIQLREKDLSARELELLAREAIGIIRENCKPKAETGQVTTSLLINSRTDVALAACAAGVHLRADDVSPQEVRTAWRRSVREPGQGTPIIAVSCHSLEEVAQAAAHGADFAVFAPIFEKKDAPEIAPAALEGLRQACSAKIPVFALGGITMTNGSSCLFAGAAGIAAIRLFQESDISKIVRALRG